MTLLDWFVVALLCILSLGVGIVFTRLASSQGADGYFTGNRSLPWWAIGLSNSATYQSGNGGFVMLILVFGIAGNWLWWGSWVVWMPLVAIIWARMWRRMQITTTAELITLRYSGRPARAARKVYAFTMFCFSVIIMAYITGFFAKTIAPLVSMSEWEILLIFGGITLVYTVMGGLTGVVYTDVLQFIILMVGSVLFLWMAIPHFGGWDAILERVRAIRPEGLQQAPPTHLPLDPNAGIPMLTLVMLIVQGLFFAGSPTAGEGMTAQRFMGAKNERHAMGGQLFNAFLSLSFRTIPLIGLGIIAMSLFWTEDLAKQIGPLPPGVRLVKDPAYAWGELVKATPLPRGFVGLLVAAEVAALMSTMSSLINWGSSFIINDFYKDWRPRASMREEVVVSRVATVALFAFAAVISVLFVSKMVSWFMFINSAMVVFLLPLAWFRFFWWRFNAWGELAATVLGLPLAVVVWFGLGFENRPFWQGVGMLFAASLVTLIVITFLTPPEPMDTLRDFYRRCRPYGYWKPVTGEGRWSPAGSVSLTKLLLDSGYGIVACTGLVVATNAMFVKAWITTAVGLTLAAFFGFLLLKRTLDIEDSEEESEISDIRSDELAAVEA